MWLSAISLLLLVAGPQPPAVPHAKPLSMTSMHEIPVPPFDWYGTVLSDDDGNLFFRVATTNFPDPVVMRLAHGSGQPSVMKVPSDADHEWQLRAYNVTRAGRFMMLCNDVKSANHALFTFNVNGEIATTTSIDIPKHVDVMDIAVFEHGQVFVAGYYNREAADELRGRGYGALFADSGVLKRTIRDVVPQTDLAKVAAELHEGAATVGSDGNLYFLTAKGVIALNASGGLVRFLEIAKPNHSTAVQLMYSQGWLMVGFAERSEKGPVKFEYAVFDALTGDTIGYYEPSSDLGSYAAAFSRREGITFLYPNNNKIELRTAELR